MTGPDQMVGDALEWAARGYTDPPESIASMSEEDQQMVAEAAQELIDAIQERLQAAGLDE